MKLTVATMARNEEKILPYFIHHYSNLVDEILLVDHGSTDKTAEIAHQMCSDFKIPLVYYKLEKQGFNEHFKAQVYKAIQQNTFKNNSDWYMIVDCDELIYSKYGDIKSTIQKHELNGEFYLRPYGYQMIHEFFPIYSGTPITEISKFGIEDPGFDKPCIVHKSLNWNPHFGLHSANCFKDNININAKHEDSFLLLHYKLLGAEYLLYKLRSFANNLDPIGIEMFKMGINGHLRHSDDEIITEFNRQFNRRKQII